MDLKYVFIRPKKAFLVVILASRAKLRRVFAIYALYAQGCFEMKYGWHKRHEPLVYSHYIIFEDAAKPTRQMQYRLNPAIKKVVMAEIFKFLMQILSI